MIRLQVSGDYACFTRPEFKAERVSYDVITPSAARGIIEAIYWKPAIRWVVDKIIVLNPINFTNIKRNEVSDKISSFNVKKAMKSNKFLYQDTSAVRQQRGSLILKDVSYIIEAHFEMTKKAEEDDTPGKHQAIAVRRMKRGQEFKHPCFGTREFGVNRYEWANPSIQKGCYSGEKDLGWMLWDLDYANHMDAIFFRAVMQDGVIEINDMMKAS